jgi:hypothetical protein
MSVQRYEAALTAWLRKTIDEKGAEILDGQVTREMYEVRKAERLAYKKVLAELATIRRKIDE